MEKLEKDFVIGLVIDKLAYIFTSFSNFRLFHAYSLINHEP